MDYGHVYIVCVRRDGNLIYKIGMTANLPQRVAWVSSHFRGDSLESALLFVYDVPVQDVRLVETLLHRRFRDNRLREALELFTLTCDDIIWLTQNPLVLLPGAISVTHSLNCPECALRECTGKPDVSDLVEQFFRLQAPARKPVLKVEKSEGKVKPRDYSSRFKDEGHWWEGQEDKVCEAFAHPPISFKKKRVD